MIPCVEQRDEIGAMARAVVVFKENAIAVRRLQTEQEAERKKADVEKRSALVGMAETDRGRDLRSTGANA